MIDRKDRQLLIGAGALMVVLVVVTALVGPARITGSAALPSSYSPAWGGAKGAYLLLGDLGYRVERWEEPAADLNMNGRGAVLILADPLRLPNGEDRAAIRRFVESGGRVLATGPSAQPFLPGASPFIAGPTWNEPEQFAAVAPSPLARGVSQISMPAPAQWRPKSIDQVTIFGNKKTAAVVSWGFGAGEVIWWAAATPLTNGGIRDAGNLALFLNSVGPAAGTRVLWDEYYHGVRGSLWSFFAQTPVPWALAQFGLMFLALMFTFSRRLGPARVPATPSRLAPLEFVDTLGDLYYTARAGPAAVGIAYGRLRFLLTRQLGLASSASAQAISRSASERIGWEEAALADLLGRAERAMRSLELGNEQALQLVREIHERITMLQIGDSTHRKEMR
ncbi:MAG: DUF4350 domain-containing protein [Acidobacteriota bacterium]|nr:DUF4350 domain-containing protein [Acidobacteriota bacterium]